MHHLHRKTPRRSKPRTQDNSTHQRGIYFSKYLAESSYFTIHPESSSYQVNSWKFTTGFIIATSRWRDREHPWPTQPCLTGWSMNGYDYPILKEITGKRFWVEWPMAYAGFFTWMGYNKTDVFPLLDAPFPDSSLKLGSPAPKECGSTFRRWQWVAVHAALARVLPKSRHAVRSQDRSTLGRRCMASLKQRNVGPCSLKPKNGHILQKKLQRLSSVKWLKACSVAAIYLWGDLAA